MYFAFAHLCLATAFLLLATQSERLAGFFYHPAMIAVVHLVTLGWISGSILGAVYVVGPLALRMTLDATKIDYAAFTLFAIGVAGIVSHFWIDSYSGMLWSAGTLLAGLTWVMVRVFAALPSAGIPTPVKLHVGFAFVNIVVAGLVGFLVGLEHLGAHVLPGFVLDSVYAHAHLAALGWATMMIVGTGYRLFPMFLPSAMPSGGGLWAGFSLLQMGAVILAVGLMLGSPWALPGAVLSGSGLVVFFVQVNWMRRHPKKAPPLLRRPDLGMVQTILALGYLAVATLLGIILILAPDAGWTPALAMVYGVCALLGFLAQMVIGIEARLLPMFAWIEGWSASGQTVPPPSPFLMPNRRLQLIVLILWLIGVPALAWGLSAANPPLVSMTAWGMLAAVVCQTVGSVIVVRHAFRGRPGAEESDAKLRPEPR